jgi:hypothetical protein
MASSTVLPASPIFSWRRLVPAVLILLALLYLADFAWYELRLQVPKLGPATGSVHRIRLLAIPNKGSRATYELDQVHPEEDVPCSHSVFPQGGTQPCWYVMRHANDPIQM